MIDLKWLRDNPAAFDKALARRGMERAAASVLAVDEERRAIETRLQEHQAERNRLSREVGDGRGRGAGGGAPGPRGGAAAPSSRTASRRARTGCARSRPASTPPWPSSPTFWPT